MKMSNLRCFVVKVVWLKSKHFLSNFFFFSQLTCQCTVCTKFHACASAPMPIQSVSNNVCLMCDVQRMSSVCPLNVTIFGDG